MQSSEVLIVEVALPARQVVFFQGLLQGEDGLAVMRCFDPQHIKQQLWTTVAQREALMDWLASLPERIGLEVLDEWIWRAGDRRTA